VSHESTNAPPARRRALLSREVYTSTTGQTELVIDHRSEDYHLDTGRTTSLREINAMIALARELGYEIICEDESGDGPDFFGEDGVRWYLGALDGGTVEAA